MPYPTGPSAAARTCPTSPAISFVPEYRRPSKINPAPNPVPKVRKTMFSHPLPAPNLHSASAQAFASFCKKAGAPTRLLSHSTMGTSSQPGKLGGERMRPLRLSSGPPQLTPIAAGASCGAWASSASSRLCQEAKSAVATAQRESTWQSSVPVTSAHFVPPISSPQYNGFIRFPPWAARR